jgi:hypothetical protein
MDLEVDFVKVKFKCPLTKTKSISKIGEDDIFLFGDKIFVSLICPLCGQYHRLKIGNI